MSENRVLRSENARLLAFVEGLTNSVVYTAVKRRDNLVKVGHTQDWERRRKEHERGVGRSLPFNPIPKKQSNGSKLSSTAKALSPLEAKDLRRSIASAIHS